MTFLSLLLKSTSLSTLHGGDTGNKNTIVNQSLGMETLLRNRIMKLERSKGDLVQRLLQVWRGIGRNWVRVFCFSVSQSCLECSGLILFEGEIPLLTCVFGFGGGICKFKGSQWSNSTSLKKKSVKSEEKDQQSFKYSIMEHQTIFFSIPAKETQSFMQ